MMSEVNGRPTICSLQMGCESRSGRAYRWKSHGDGGGCKLDSKAACWRLDAVRRRAVVRSGRVW